MGRIVCSMLGAGNHHVFGMTRRPEMAGFLKTLQVTPVIADVYDLPKLRSCFKSIRPELVIHQLTDLPFGLPSEKMEAARIANARIRDAGTRNLILAGMECGVERFIAQSIAFVYRDGALPHTESDPLASDALRDFENQVLDGDFEGIVLRYGKFYGPNTGFDAPSGPCHVHVGDAARAAVLSVSRGKQGVYNIVEDKGVVSSAKAKLELGWVPEHVQ